MCRYGVLVGLVLILTTFGCGGGDPGAPSANLADVPLLLAAGNLRVDPQPEGSTPPAADLGRFGIGDVAAVYRITTPADQPFSFDLLTRNPSNTGAVRVSLAHASDGGVDPGGGPGTIAQAGIVPSASGGSNRGEWFDARGDGFARVTLRGSIERDQVLAIEVEEEGEILYAVVEIAIGPVSPINLDSPARGTYPGILDEQTLYSSNSWRFGLPTIAVSGDRTSIVAYEGDEVDPYRFDRYEMRLQHDSDTGDVTGGGEIEPSPDYGHWRDHEIAALFNVLALARCGMEEVTLKLSFDRGATFGQVETYGQSQFGSNTHLVQVTMALDYTLALLFWKTDRFGASELILIEGQPSTFDSFGSPTAFSFDPPHVLYASALSVSPVLMGAVYSEGGDLVIGYGFTTFDSDPTTFVWTATTQFRCAVRKFGGTFTDTLVEESVIVGKDPSVAVKGSGDELRVFYAYEGSNGVRLRDSDDGGRTWSAPISMGNAISHMPTVFARLDGDICKVDVLYLSDRGFGQEIHLRHWDDFDSGAPADYRLTTAETVDADTLPPNVPPPGVAPGTFAPDVGVRTTHVAWFGYDAVLDDDEIVVVYDEETYFSWLFLGGPDIFFEGPRPLGPEADAASGSFAPAEPPPLAPGLTEPVDPPDPDDLHQLKILRLE